MMGTKRTEKACATRKQLLEAALAVIGEKGYSAATVDEIVDAAGVSKGVAYYHFKSKAVMAESILEEGIGGLIEGFERIAAEAPTAPEALTGMVELFATSIFENKAFGRFFVSELWREGRVWQGPCATTKGACWTCWRVSWRAVRGRASSGPRSIQRSRPWR